MNRPPQVTESHLRRGAGVLIRQSSAAQERDNVGSAMIQRELVDVPRRWSWPESLIEIRDELGVSAHEPGSREEFEAIIDDIENDRLGALFVSAANRIGRNEEDQGRFMYRARKHDVLLVVGIGGATVYDFRDPNQAFTGAILGFAAVHEHRVRLGIGRESKLHKARAGLEPSAFPIGYARPVKSRPWQKTDDDRVRERIQLVWDKILEIRSGRGLVRYLRVHGLQLPFRRRGGDVGWRDATWSQLTHILKNPAYCGMYVYGRTRTDERAPRNRRQVPASAAGWIIKENAHPAYVSPSHFQEVQELLARNTCKLAGPAGRGEALLPGLLHCGIHGTKLAPRYSNRERLADGTVRRVPQYVCSPSWEAGTTDYCCSIAARRPDVVVEQAFFARVPAVTADDIREALREDLRQHEALGRAREEQLRRAERREADLERDFTETDPGLRPIKERLAVLWSEARQKVGELKAKARMEPLSPPAGLEEAELQELRAFLDRLPQLWRDSGVTAQQRKTVLRILIREISVMPSRDEWKLAITWVNGETSIERVLTRAGLRAVAQAEHLAGGDAAAVARRLTDLRAVRPAGGEAARQHTKKTAGRLIRGIRVRHELDERAYRRVHARFLEGRTYQAMADELNAAGIPHRRGAWTKSRVRRAVLRIRRRSLYGLPVLPPPSRLLDEVTRLADEGCEAPEIHRRLIERDVRTSGRRVPTLKTVEGALRRAGRGPKERRADRDEQLRHLWEQHGSNATVAQRANDLGVRTRRGNRWTPSGMARKLWSLGVRERRCLRVPRPRGDAPAAGQRPAS